MKLYHCHADDGFEYVDRRLATRLNKLRAEFTKSRPRRSNDNALVEGKNAHVVRKHLGHEHITVRFASDVDLNFHRPCLFATERIDEGLARRAETLAALPGVGRTTAAGLLAAMPELGSLDARAAAVWQVWRPWRASPASGRASASSRAGGAGCAACSTWPRSRRSGTTRTSAASTAN